MRLLECQIDHGKFKFIEYFGNDIPRYAILSHTWGSDRDEVTFKDLTEGTGTNKPGYDKIDFCAKEAAKDGLKYFWVDTCCIDKTSSAELQEAINSMFLWYQKAAECYVYLSDVSTNPEILIPQNTPMATWEAAFWRSRWFTRGWTLQELLAPASVIFFSRECERLGSKMLLEQHIHEITGIPVKALRGHLSHFSVEERLSWARKRQTKREEDQAYSLFGIFGIHMPLIYGEGGTNAYMRMREEIEKSSSSKRKWDSYAGNMLHYRHARLTPPMALDSSAMSFTKEVEFVPRSLFELQNEGLSDRAISPLSHVDSGNNHVQDLNQRALDCPLQADGHTINSHVKASGKENLKNLTKHQKEHLLKSLKFDQIGVRHLTIKNAYESTCSWLLQMPKYVDWLDDTKLHEHHGFFWIKGKPGAGKSTLMKFALTECDTKRITLDSVLLSFFFNARGSNLEKSIIGMYRALLLQLFEQHPQVEIKEGPELRPFLEYLVLLLQHRQGYPTWSVVAL